MNENINICQSLVILKENFKNLAVKYINEITLSSMAASCRLLRASAVFPLPSASLCYSKKVKRLAH